MAVVALEQRDPQALLQLADGAREGGGADVARLAGAAEVQGVGQGEELGEGAGIHGGIISHCGM